MKLVAGLPDPSEYPVDLKITPRNFHAGDAVKLTFRILDPITGKQVTKFQEVHEKLFHLFLVSKDLEFFAHEHPRIQPDGSFLFAGTLPKTGEYRLLCDFFPQGGTPQLISKTLIAPGASRQPELSTDLTSKNSVNMQASMTTEPARPIAGMKTMLFVHLTPAEGLEPYLGAWGHMLAASSDLVDMIHTHPAFGEAGSTIQFNIIFPRPGLHRVWAQFQRLGMVNTFAFDVPVSALQ